MMLKHLEMIGLGSRAPSAAAGGVLASFSDEAKFTIMESVQRELTDMLLQGPGEKDYRAVASAVHVNWHMEVLGGCFALPLTDPSHVKLIHSVIVIYVNFLGVSGKQPPVVKDMSQEVAVRIVCHFSQIFQVRPGIQKELFDKQKWLCKWTIDVIECLISDDGLDFERTEWVKVLSVLVGLCDYAFQEEHEHSTIFDAELQSRMVRVLFLLWLKSESESVEVCHLMQTYIASWREKLPAVQMSCSVLQACSECLVSNILSPARKEAQPRSRSASRAPTNTWRSAPDNSDSETTSPSAASTDPAKLLLVVPWNGGLAETAFHMPIAKLLYFWQQFRVAVTDNFSNRKFRQVEQSSRYSISRLEQLCKSTVQAQEAVIAGIRESIDAFKSVETTFVVTSHPLHQLLQQAPMFRRNSIHDVIGLTAGHLTHPVLNAVPSNRQRATSTNVAPQSEKGTGRLKKDKLTVSPFPFVDNSFLIHFFGETLIAAALDERAHCFTSRSVAFHILSKLMIESRQKAGALTHFDDQDTPRTAGEQYDQHVKDRLTVLSEHKQVHLLYFAAALSYITNYCEYIDIAQEQRKGNGGALYIPSSVESDIACFFVSGWKLFGCDDVGIISGCKFLLPHVGTVIRFMLTEQRRDTDGDARTWSKPSTKVGADENGPLRAAAVALPDTPHFLGNHVLKHVRRACVRVVASLSSLPNYYDGGKWKQRGLFFTEQTEHTTSHVADERTGSHESEGQAQHDSQSSSVDDYRGIRSWLGKTLTDALGTVKDATTLQLLLHVLAHKVLEDSLISPGIAQIAISLITARITMKSSALHHWPLEVKISALNALQTMSSLQDLIHKAATATIPSLLKKLASYLIKLTVYVVRPKSQSSGRQASNGRKAPPSRGREEPLDTSGRLHLIKATLECMHQWLCEAPWVMQLADVADLLSNSILLVGSLKRPSAMANATSDEDWGVDDYVDIQADEVYSKMHTEAMFLYSYVMHNIGHTPFVDVPSHIQSNSPSSNPRNEDVFYSTDHNEDSLLDLLRSRYHQRQGIAGSHSSKTTNESSLVRHFLLNKRAVVSVIMYGGEVSVARADGDRHIFTIPAAAELAILIRHGFSGKVAWIASPKLLTKPFQFREATNSVPVRPAPANPGESQHSPLQPHELDFSLSTEVVSIVEHERDYARCGWVNRQYIASSGECFPSFGMYVQMFQSADQYDSVAQQLDYDVDEAAVQSQSGDSADPNATVSDAEPRGATESTFFDSVSEEQETYVQKLAAQACWVVGRALLSQIGVGNPSEKGLEPLLVSDDASSTLGKSPRRNAYKSYAEAVGAVLEQPRSFNELLSELDATPTRWLYNISVVALKCRAIDSDNDPAKVGCLPRALRSAEQIHLGPGGQRFSSFLKSLGWLRPSTLAKRLNVQPYPKKLSPQLVSSLQAAEHRSPTSSERHHHLYFSDARKEIYFGVSVSTEEHAVPVDNVSSGKRQDTFPPSASGSLFPLQAPQIVQIVWNECQFDLQLNHFDWIISKQV